VTADELQRALAASQQDLTRALDDAAASREEAAEVRVTLAAVCESRDAVERERDGARHDLAHAEFKLGTAQLSARQWRDRAQTATAKHLEARRDLDLTRAELASARTELEQLRRLLPSPDENRG
jgi:chromosome segregation ATPase